MNYRHAFHAGNFADVFKHMVLAYVLRYLKQKEAPLRVIDTHAGIGLYNLTGPQAVRTGEWLGGIARLRAAHAAGDIDALDQPYFECVQSFMKDDAGEAMLYPGSPLIAQALLRPHDRMIFCEKHPEDVLALKRAVGRDRRAKVLDVDGWQALKAFVPPPEKRGLVLIDPPFEATDEFERLANGLIEAHKRWATGLFMAWYPIKNRAHSLKLEQQVREATASEKILRLDLFLSNDETTGPLSACGLLLINPPYTLYEDGPRILTRLKRLLRA